MILRASSVFACLATLMALSACATAPVQSVPIQLGSISRGAPLMTRTVTSWTERKFTNLVRQQTDFSCGAAALATIFNYAYDRRTTEQQVLLNMLKIADPDLVRDKGFSLLDMKNYTQALGMTAEGYQVDYRALFSLKVPAIALLDIKGYKHFVVIQRANPEYINLGDPALGNRTMSRKAFEAAWNGVAFVVLGDGYDADTVLLNPPKPISAARLYGMRSPVQNAEIYDYGLGPAFNFQL
jgi:predicted double-glycine peptidase